MNEKELNEKMSDLMGEYKAGIFFGMRSGAHGIVACNTTNGIPNNIIASIVTTTLRSNDDVKMYTVRDILYQSVINIMLSDPDHATDFFKQLCAMTAKEDSENESIKTMSKVIKMKFK